MENRYTHWCLDSPPVRRRKYVLITYSSGQAHRAVGRINSFNWLTLYCKVYLSGLSARWQTKTCTFTEFLELPALNLFSALLWLFNLLPACYMKAFDYYGAPLSHIAGIVSLLIFLTCFIITRVASSPCNWQ